MHIWLTKSKIEEYNIARTAGFEDTENLVTSHKAHLRDTVRVTEGNTNLGRSETFAGELCDVLNDILRRSLEPWRWCTAVRECRGRYMDVKLESIGAKRNKIIQMPLPGACMRPMIDLHSELQYGQLVARNYYLQSAFFFEEKTIRKSWGWVGRRLCEWPEFARVYCLCLLWLWLTQQLYSSYKP